MLPARRRPPDAPMTPPRTTPGAVACGSEVSRDAAASRSDEARPAGAGAPPLPFVREGLASKSLYFSLEDVQSRMQLQRPDVLDLDYTRTMMGFLLFAPAPARILMVGLGGGSLAKFCFRHLPHASIDVVEINPHVLALRDAFRVPPDGARFHVIEADGAAFMETTTNRYDIVVLDAFGPQGLPAALARQRFYDDCADTLSPGGVLVANLHSAASDCAACVVRIGRSFDGEALVVGDRSRVNSIVFARKGAALLPPAGALAAQPAGIDGVAWEQLENAFGRIAATLARRDGEPRGKELRDAG